MNYQKLSQLSSDKLRGGIKCCLSNAEDLYESAVMLAEKSKYGLASSHLVLAIEEIMKAYGVFLVWAGEKDAEAIDSFFKAKYIHKARLKYASYINKVCKEIESKVNLENYLKPLIKDTSKTMKETNNPEEFCLKLLSKLNMGDLLERVQIDKHQKKLLLESVDEKSNWYLHAQKIKERGIYSELVDSQWHSPSNITSEKFKKVKIETNEVFGNIKPQLSIVISSNNFTSDLYRYTYKEIINYINNMPAEEN